MSGADGDPWRRRRDLVRSSILAHLDSDEPGLVDLLAALCSGAAAHLELRGAAVNLMSSKGSEGVVAASDAACKDLVEMQFTSGEGPCHDAFALRRPMLAPDLASAREQRWRGYASLAVEAGVRSVFALPLQVGAAGLGVLDLFGEHPGALDDERVAIALTFAQVATEILLDGRLTTADGNLDPDLESALDYRSEIFQAQGMLMIVLGIGLAESLSRMRAHAFCHGSPLVDLAHEIISGRVFEEGEI